jgi:4-amino-4-deoxy-L-arabinose transferase-like glycosyltransferase
MTADGPSFSFWKEWPWWSIPALISLGLVLTFVDPFIGDWDGLDYTMLSVAGYPSSMALGRNLFIFGNYALYETAHFLFGLQPDKAYLLFKYAVVAQAPLAVIACWALARHVSSSVYSASLAALFVVFSPVFVLYGGQVMTDVPSVLLLALALIIHLRGLKANRVWMVMVGAALLGLGMNLRETMGVYLPWLILAPFVFEWKLNRRTISVILISCALFFFFAFSWWAFWFFTDAHYSRIWYGWRESMQQESARHPAIAFKNLLPYLGFFFASAPIVFLSLPFAFLSEWRRNKLTPMLLLAAIGLFANLALFFNYSTAINWRYFLTGLPALAPLSAAFLIRVMSRRVKNNGLAFAACAIAVVAVGVTFGLLVRKTSRQFAERRAISKEYRQQLTQVPSDAVMISGAQTIAVTYWKAMGAGTWKTVGTGGGWPGDKNLVPTIEEHMTEGRRVFIDADPRWWMPCGWQRDELPAIANLQNHFRFRRVSPTIYELRSLQDQSANDSPQLETLLPENRPEDTRKCAPLTG